MAGAVLCGCASFSTIQTDKSYLDENGNEVREIVTRVKARTFFESSSQLSQFKATQTDRSQSASVGSLNQSANATNLTRMVEVGTEAATKAILEYFMPK
jgi:hypothetical protein